MIKMEYIREYVSLAETLNYSKTSESMFVSLSALSRHIAAVEEAMGAKLFMRNTRNVILTEEGKLVYQCFVEILKKYDETRGVISCMASGLHGKLRISSPYYWTQEYTEPLVQKLYSTCPECQVEIVSCLPGDGYDAVRSGKSDVAICFDMLDPVRDQEIRRVPFSYEHFCIFADNSLDIAKAESLHLSDLKGQVFLTMEDPKYPDVLIMLKNMLESGGVERPDILAYPIDQIDIAGMLIHQTKRLGLMMSCLKQQNRSYLKCIPLEDEAALIPLYLFYRMDNVNPLVVKLAQIAMCQTAD